MLLTGWDACGRSASETRLREPRKPKGLIDLIQKKIPQRQCVGCREQRPKGELVRVVRSPEGQVSIDTRGKKPGRGAYVCPKEECLKKAVKSRALGRALGVEIPPEIYDTLRAQMEAGE